MGSGDSALRLQNQLLLHMVVQQQQQHQQQLLQQQKSIEQLHGKFNQILSSLTSETLSLPATPSLPALTAQLYSRVILDIESSRGDSHQLTPHHTTNPTSQQFRISPFPEHATPTTSG